jgi:hypothetical protein
MQVVQGPKVQLTNSIYQDFVLISIPGIPTVFPVSEAGLREIVLANF